MERLWRVGSISMECGGIVGTTEVEILRRSSDGDGEGRGLVVVGAGNLEDLPFRDSTCVDGFSEDAALQRKKGVCWGAANGQVDHMVTLLTLERALFFIPPHGATQRILDPERSDGSLPFFRFLR